jgi:hypothetical protein
MRSIGRKSFAAVAAGALAFGMMTAASTAAHADPAPSGADIVGVGSDTLQYMLDFGADGDFNGNAGYNTSKLARLESIDATPDANARAGYLNGSTSSALLALNPTVVLTAPVPASRRSSSTRAPVRRRPSTSPARPRRSAPRRKMPARRP